MTDAPENIWAWANMAEDGSGHDRGVWYTEDAGLDGDETQYIRADIHEALEAEMNHFRKSGIVEVAVRNPNVADYMAHWEGRTDRAEAENKRLREALREIYNTGQSKEPDHWKFRKMARQTARAALEDKG